MLCILCMTNSRQAINIFEEDGIRLNISSIIGQHFWLEPSTSNADNQIICTSCWDVLDSFHQFYEKVKEAHNMLLKVELYPHEEVKAEMPSFTDYSDPADVDLLVKDIKVENSEDSDYDPRKFDIETKVNLLEVIEKTYEILPDIKYESETESEVSLFKLAEPRQPSKRNKVTDFDSESDSQNKYVCKKEPVQPKSKKKMRDVSSFRAAKAINDEVINQNMKLLCDICHVSLENFSDLQKHFQSLHNTSAYVACCDRKFYKRSDLADHILLHKNPEHFKCDQCGKVVTSRKGLADHNRMIHDKQFIYECDKCSRKFQRKLQLDRHMDAHVIDRKFQCEQCEKFFVSKSSLGHHIYGVHKDGYKKVCEQCGKVTRNAEGLRLHMLEHTNEPKPFVNCGKCGIRLANKNGLRKHMKGAHTLHVCNFCGTVAPTIYALKRHVANTHKTELSTNIL